MRYSVESNTLLHFGIPKMRWGERRFQLKNGKLTPEGRERYRKSSGESGKSNTSSKRPTLNKRGTTAGMGGKTNGVYDRDDGTKDTARLKKDAKKDAEDMARAKAYYGEGAGNRRKQIRNRISERMKDPDYKAEYEKQLAAQDMSKHQKAANRERHAQDAKNTVAKTARGIKNLIMGVGSASLTAVALYNAAKLVGADKVIADAGKQLLNKIRR